MKKKFTMQDVKKALYWIWREWVDIPMMIVVCCLAYYDTFVSHLQGVAIPILLYAMFSVFRIGYWKAIADDYIEGKFLRDYLRLRKKDDE